jgi:hypothetical protein
MTNSKHLRLVAFNPNDTSLSEVLVRSSQEEIKDHDQMSAIMSLYFQWRNC